MSYDKADLEKKALAAIKRNKIKFITHVSAFLPCALSTFYELELEKSETIKRAVEDNRTNAKVKALNRWEKSKNPTLEVAFYKLIADEDEAHRLNGTKQEIKSDMSITEYRVIEPKVDDDSTGADS
jgi:hypothetical protein